MDELTVKWIDGWMALDGLIDLETEEEDGASGNGGECGSIHNVLHPVCG